MADEGINKFGPTDPSLKKKLGKVREEGDPIEEDLDDIEKKLNKCKDGKKDLDE